MLRTLGLDDETEPNALVREVERAFDVEISHGEAKVIFNVGQLFDLLRGKVHSSEASRKCACAMSFYRIRRALDDLRIDIGRSPSSDLAPLHRVYTKPFAESLGEKSGLRLPRPDLGSMGRVGVAVIGVGVLGAPLVLVAGLLSTFFSTPPARSLPTAASALFFGGLVAGLTLVRVDAGRLPRSCRTLGDLAAKAANLSYGRLVKQGADARDDRIWKAMTEIMSDFAKVPADQIARDTYFLASALKSCNTAA